MINTQRQLRNEIHAVQSTLTNEQIFLSPAYEHMLTEMGHGVTNCSFHGKSHMMNRGNDIAYTDSNDIYINYASKHAQSIADRESQHRFFLGLNLHEYGHILFTDFRLSTEVRKNLMENKLYPMPKDNNYLRELLEFMADEKNQTVALQGIHHRLDNCIEDGFVNRAVCTEVPGYADCLHFSKKVTLATCISYKEMQERKIPLPLIFTNLILMYCVYGEKAYEEEETAGDELLESFEACLGWLRKAVYEANPLERKRYVNTVFCHLFHFIKMDVEKQQEQEETDEEEAESKNNSEDDSKKDSKNDAAASNEALNDAISKLNNSMEDSENVNHKNTSAPNEEALQALADRLNPTEESDTSSENNKDCGGDEAATQLGQIAQAVATAQVSESQEVEIKEQMDVDVSEAVQTEELHENISFECTRASLSAYAIERYNAIHSELDTIVRRFIKDFEQEIKDRQLGDTLNGLYAGKRLDTNHLYRSDKRLFTRKILPEDIPDMAVGILVDCSGSMDGSRIEISRKCAYITYAFCTKMKIPCFVIGHTTKGWTVTLTSVADEKCLDNNDKIRIFGLEASGGNRDGFALRYCLKKLEKIPANDKLMMIISDGQPAHYNYYLQEGQVDCQSAVHDAIKKGIWTIAAGIGTDAPSVNRVYKEGRSDNDSASFLDLSDMQRLPKAFIKIIKKRLEKTS